MPCMPRGLIAAAVALWAFVVWPTSGLADQVDLRLDGLFERLEITHDHAEASRIERQIWQIWMESGDFQVQIWMRQGVAAMSLHRLDLALDRFDRMVEHAPDFAEGWNKRATVHYLMGDYSASVYDIQRTLDLEPRHFGALSGLGLIYDALEKPAAAIRSYEAALALNPHLEGTRKRIEDLRRELRGRRS
jgi:tetratricopeptide (TPR) repeat protein